MRRLVLLGAAVALLAGVSGRPAAAAPRPTTAAPSPATTMTAMTATAATFTWLRHTMPGFEVGPSRPTGYGRADLSGFARGCPDCGWYRVTNRLTNHQPTARLSTPGIAVKAPDWRAPDWRAPDWRAHDWCWPWENFPWSGDGCWNNMATWDWAKIFDHFNYRPVWDRHSTVDRIVGCYHGAYDGFAGGVIGKHAIGLLLDVADLVRVTPAGIAYSVVSGCTFSLFHN
jgi:hypothetical protein